MYHGKRKIRKPDREILFYSLQPCTDSTAIPAGDFCLPCRKRLHPAFRGQDLFITGVGKVAHWQPAEIAKQLAKAFRSSGESVLQIMPKVISVWLSSPLGETIAYRSLLSPFQIYFSKSVLSNHLIHAVPRESPLTLDEKYLRKFLYYRVFDHTFIRDTPLVGVQRLRGGHLIQFNADGDVKQDRILVKRVYQGYEDLSEGRGHCASNSRPT